MTRTAAAAVLAVAAVAAAGCGLADHSQPASFADVRSAIAQAGLRVCDHARTEARAPGAVEERRYDVAFACGDADDEAVVVATAYDGESDRDGAVLRYQLQPSHAKCFADSGSRSAAFSKCFTAVSKSLTRIKFFPLRYSIFASTLSSAELSGV